MLKFVTGCDDWCKEALTGSNSTVQVPQLYFDNDDMPSQVLDGVLKRLKAVTTYS